MIRYYWLPLLTSVLSLLCVDCWCVLTFRWWRQLTLTSLYEYHPTGQLNHIINHSMNQIADLHGIRFGMRISMGSASGSASCSQCPARKPMPASLSPRPVGRPAAVLSLDPDSKGSAARWSTTLLWWMAPQYLCIKPLWNEVDNADLSGRGCHSINPPISRYMWKFFNAQFAFIVVLYKAIHYGRRHFDKRQFNLL